MSIEKLPGFPNESQIEIYKILRNSFELHRAICFGASCEHSPGGHLFALLVTEKEINKMTVPSERVPTKKRAPLLWILGGCAVLFLCVSLALAANAIFWIARTDGSRAGANPPPAEGGIQAAVEALPEGDASRGESVFREVENCQACHAIDSDERGAGPSLSGISARAAEQKPGYSAQMYLYEAVVHPNAHVVSGFPSGVMPGKYRSSLTDQQLADLLAFLMTR